MLAGTADVARAELDLPQLSRLLHLSARRGPHDGAAVRDLALPRRRLGRRPLPARGVRRRARGLRAAGRRALVRPARARPRAGRAAAARRRAGSRRHRRSVADRLALPRARVPPCLLGRRHDARPAARGRRLARGCPRALYSRFPDATVTALVGADGVHEWPVAVVALGEGVAGARPDRSGGRRRGRRGTRSSSRSSPSAQRAGDRDTLGHAVGPRRRGRRTRPGDRPGRDRRAGPRVAAPDGPHPRACRRALLRTSMPAALRGIDVPHLVVVHDVEGLDARCLPMAGPRRPGARRCDARRALPGVPGAGPRVATRRSS